MHDQLGEDRPRRAGRPGADDVLLGRDRRRSLAPAGLESVLAEWSASLRHHDDSTARTRQRWLRQQLEEEGTFAGLLLDLAERNLPVIVHARGGRTHRGVLVGVATDCAVLRLPSGVHVLLPYRSIAGLRPEQATSTPAGDRAAGMDLGLAELLAALVGDRPRVLVFSLDGTEGLSGELRAVGQDVISVRLEAGGRSTVFVPVASISEITVEG